MAYVFPVAIPTVSGDIAETSFCSTTIPGEENALKISYIDFAPHLHNIAEEQQDDELLITWVYYICNMF